MVRELTWLLLTQSVCSVGIGVKCCDDISSLLSSIRHWRRWKSRRFDTVLYDVHASVG